MSQLPERPGKKHAAPDVEDVSRRTALKVLGGLAALTYGFLGAYPIVRFLRGDLGEDGPRSSLRLGSLSYIQGKGWLLRTWGKEPVIAVAKGEEVRAFSAVCTHLGCTVAYNAERGHIVCGCHGAGFDADTGVPLYGPASEPLPQYQTTIDERGQVSIPAEGEQG